MSTVFVLLKYLTMNQVIRVQYSSLIFSSGYRQTDISFVYILLLFQDTDEKRKRGGQNPGGQGKGPSESVHLLFSRPFSA